MVDIDVVTSKLRELAQRLARVRARRPADPEALGADQDALDLVSFNLMLAVQVCLDIASHIISDQGWEPAATLAESFRRLGEHGVISQPTAAALRQAAGLRNLVAHGYAEVQPALIYTAAETGIADLERFEGEVSSWLLGSAGKRES